jgi:phage terminase large subunit
MDFGYSTDPLALIALYKLNDEIIIDEIIYQKGLLNSEAASQMKQLGIKGEIFADSAEPKSIAEIKKYGLEQNI